jgi:pimeloyl-ACP methyl ester carboxylesterase
MVHWYRALLRHPSPAPADVRIHMPALILWGARDRFIERRVADESLAYCDRGRLEVVEEATHWLQHEEPEWVNRMLIEFLGGATAPRA